MNSASARLETLAHLSLARRRQRLENLTAKLEQLNPRMVLARGYAIVLNEQGRIVKEAAGAPTGSELRLLFARDGVKAKVIQA